MITLGDAKINRDKGKQYKASHQIAWSQEINTGEVQKEMGRERDKIRKGQGKRKELWVHKQTQIHKNASVVEKERNRILVEEKGEKVT